MRFRNKTRTRRWRVGLASQWSCHHPFRLLTAAGGIGSGPYAKLRGPEGQHAQQDHFHTGSGVRRQRQICLAHERDLIVELDILRGHIPRQGRQHLPIRILISQGRRHLLA